MLFLSASALPQAMRRSLGNMWWKGSIASGPANTPRIDRRGFMVGYVLAGTPQSVVDGINAYLIGRSRPQETLLAIADWGRIRVLGERASARGRRPADRAPTYAADVRLKE